MTTDREALAELVALKDLKAQVEALSYGGFQGKVTSSGGMEWEDRHAECEKLKAEYARRKPLAWAAARARLALPEAGRWISVTERLPKVHGVLYPVMLAGEKPKLWMGFRAGGGWEPTPTECEEDDAREVTHWFELPPLLPAPSKDDLTEARGNEGAEIGRLRWALAQVKLKAASLADAQVIALDALAAPQINATELPVAYVPIHPRNGPLWAMTTDTPDPQRLPSYPLMQLYADPINAPAGTPALPSEGKS